MSPYTRPSGRDIPLLFDGPNYRLKLTLWYIDRDRLTPNNSTVIRKRFPTAAAANVEAFELAQCCLSEGESIMLADRKTIGDDTLNEYAIGKWDTVKVEIPMDSSEFVLHRPNPYFKRNTLGTVSDLIQVIQVGSDDGIQLGSPLIGKSRKGSMHATRHPASAQSQGLNVLIRRQPSRIRAYSRKVSVSSKEARLGALEDVQELRRGDRYGKVV